MDDQKRPNGIPVTRFTLQSIYAQSDDEKLEFEYESGTMNIIVSVHNFLLSMTKSARTFQSQKNARNKRGNRNSSSRPRAVHRPARKSRRVEAGSGTDRSGNSDGEEDEHSVINLAGFLTQIPKNK